MLNNSRNPSTKPNNQERGKSNRGGKISNSTNQSSNVPSSNQTIVNSSSNASSSSSTGSINQFNHQFNSQSSSSRGRGGNYRGRGYSGKRGNSRGGKQAFKVASSRRIEQLDIGVISFGFWKDDPLQSKNPTFYNYSKFMFDKNPNERKRIYSLKKYGGTLRLDIKYDKKLFEMQFNLGTIKNGIRLFKEGENYILEMEPKSVPLLLERQYLECFGENTHARICSETDKLFENIGNSYVYLLKLDRYQDVLKIIPNLFELLEGKIDSIPIEKIKFPYSFEFPCYSDRVSELDFKNIQYYLLVLESHGIFHPCNYTENFFQLLKGDESQEYKNKIGTLLEKIYYDYTIKYPSRVFNPEETIDKYLKSKDFQLQMNRSILIQNSPQEITLIKKLVVTPTKIYYLPPEVDKTNRVIRYVESKWGNKDNFFRVNFLDDNFNKLFAASFRNISNRVKNIMTRGIEISTMRLEFLGFSSSQLRNSSSWFFLRDQYKNLKPSPQDIRDYMGDFSDISTASKVAARFGQCLTSTTPSIILEEEIVPIDDIVHPDRDDYIFTDGIGLIGEEMMKIVHQQLQLSCDTAPPSAIQFRCGGVKGVLVLDRRLDGDQIIFRKSQYKFTSIQKQLEIVDYSKRRSGFLNRQFITILKALGIEDNIFLKKQKEMINSILQITNDVSKAYQWLAIYHSTHTKAFICHVLKHVPELATSETFINNMLKSYKEQLLKGLKEKTKIFVEKSAYLMGVIDEFGVLEENEIFVNLSPMLHRPYAEYGVIKARCIVGKNPSLHKGDIRIVTAVDRPELHHLHDVIVFPQKGARPITNMITGSDLDGDQFFVYWDEELIPKENYKPMDYSTVKEVFTEVPKIKEEDIIDFFIEYITKNNLGLIANTHLANSDFRKDGLLSKECLKLCELHSIAVDSAKSGKFASIPQFVKLRRYPHFMIGSELKKYKSDQILGKLFDETLPFNFEAKHDVCQKKHNPLLIVDGFDKYLKEIEPHYHNFSRFVKSDMIKYGIEDESQIITGWINTKIKSYGHKEQDVHETISVTIFFYLKHFRKVFEEMVTKYGESERLAIASAWYYITHTEKNQYDIFSFGWINYKELVIIASKEKRIEDNNEEILDLDSEAYDEDDDNDYNEDLIDLAEDESEVESTCSSDADSWTEGMDDSYFHD